MELWKERGKCRIQITQKQKDKGDTKTLVLYWLSHLLTCKCKIILFLYSVEYWESTGGKCAKPHLITKRSMHVSHAHKSKNNNKQPQNRSYKRWKTNQCQKEKRGRDKEASQISCRKGKANVLVQQDDSQKQTFFFLGNEAIAVILRKIWLLRSGNTVKYFFSWNHLLLLQYAKMQKLQQQHRACPAHRAHQSNRACPKKFNSYVLHFVPETAEQVVNVLKFVSGACQ